MLRRCCPLLLLVTVACLSWAKPLPPKPRFSVEQFERWADEMPFFCADEFFMYGRTQGSGFRWEVPEKFAHKHRDVLTRVMFCEARVDDLLKLLKHPSGGVRMLALAALMVKGEGRLLPVFAEAMQDTTTGLPRPHLMRMAYIQVPPPPTKMPALKRQTVGDVARGAVKTYLAAAGIFTGPDPGQLEEAYARYWAERKDRSHCASWFGVRVLRATHGTSDVTVHDKEALAKIRADIDKLPPRDRAWVLFWLGSRRGEYSAEYFFKNDEIVQAGKAIGAADLLAMLAGDNPSGDPDLASKNKEPSGGRWMQVLVLEHSAELLEPKMAQRLLELGEKEKEQLASWSIAAARLAPERSAAILDKALAELTYKYGGHERARLAVEMWRSQGLKKSRELLDWFYGEKIGAAFGYFSSHAFFIRQVGQGSDAATKTFFARLLDDPRFTGCDWQSVLALNEQIGRWTQTPVLSEEEIRNNNPAAGADFEAHLASAHAMYPEGTQRSLHILAERRFRLRASLTDWAPAGR